MTQKNEGFARVSEAASFLNCSSGTIHNMIARGNLPAIRVGKLTRIPWSALRELVDGQLG